MLTWSSEGVLASRVRELEALPALPAAPTGRPSWPGLHVRPTRPASDAGDLRVPQAAGSPSQHCALAGGRRRLSMLSLWPAGPHLCPETLLSSSCPLRMARAPQPLRPCLCPQDVRLHPGLLPMDRREAPSPHSPKHSGCPSLGQMGGVRSH